MNPILTISLGMIVGFLISVVLLLNKINKNLEDIRRQERK